MERERERERWRERVSDWVIIIDQCTSALSSSESLWWSAVLLIYALTGVALSGTL